MRGYSEYFELPVRIFFRENFHAKHKVEPEHTQKLWLFAVNDSAKTRKQACKGRHVIP